jgi:hypothetical protein
MGVFGLIIVGGGAAGLGPLVWAAQAGQLDSLLNRGVAIVERSGRLGGDIGRYVVNADSLGTSFVEFLEKPAAQPVFAALADHPATRQLRQTRDQYPTLALVGAHLQALGAELAGIVSRHPGGAVLLRCGAEALALRRDGTVAVRLASGEMLRGSTVVMAPGGTQDLTVPVGREIVPGVPLAAIAPEKIVASDRLLTETGVAAATALLAPAQEPRAVVIGGSHSAFSAAWVLLNKLPGRFGAGGLTLLHRRAPRVFYPSRALAAADGYAFDEGDVCPATGRVHRLGGLRNDGRALWRQLTARPGTTPEPRMRMLALDDAVASPAALRRLLDEAALVVPAFGYRLDALPVFDAAGRRLALMAETGGAAVDELSRLLLADGQPVPNLFAAGLGSGFRPWGTMAGEANFQGQQNSLWLYQNGLGQLICEGAAAWLDRAPAPAPTLADEATAS